MTILVLDGSNILHRAISGIEPDKKTEGFLIALVLSMMNKICKRFKHKHITEIWFLWDSGVPLFRRGLYRNYKEMKVPIGDNISEEYLSDVNKYSPEQRLQAGIVDDVDFLRLYGNVRRELHEKLLPALAINSIRLVNSEADDVAAHLCYETEDSVVLISTDRDWRQLVSDRLDIFVLDPIRDTIQTEQTMIEEFGKPFRPCFLTYKALVGDASDTIPSFASGIGEKAAMHYARQLTQKQPLTIAPRGNKDAFAYLSNNVSLLDSRRNLVDLFYPIKENLEYSKDIQQCIKNMRDNPINHNESLFLSVLSQYNIQKIDRTTFYHIVSSMRKL